MCLAIPGKLIEKRESELGLVDLGGIVKEISLTFVPSAKAGDWLIIHTGFALEIMSEKDALESIEILQQIYKT